MNFAGATNEAIHGLAWRCGLPRFARNDKGDGSFFVLPVAAETAVGGGLAGFRVVEGLDGEGQGSGRRLVVIHGSPRRCALRDVGKLRLGWLRFFLGHVVSPAGWSDTFTRFGRGKARLATKDVD